MVIVYEGLATFPLAMVVVLVVVVVVVVPPPEVVVFVVVVVVVVVPPPGGVSGLAELWLEKLKTQVCMGRKRVYITLKKKSRKRQKICEK